MATITTDTFLDGGVARTAGEGWTMNGGVLTIRTDTRWHANAPAGMTGSFSSMAISSTLGGGILIDSRNVREVWFNSGSGTVPAIGTTITQGGVSGYLLGVYSNLAQAPTTVGQPMPSEGFIKFREVTGGSFSAGTLTGIGATALGADRVSWIEVVMDQATAITVPRLGFFRTRGAWYELLETTSGTAGQLVQLPTNGGGGGSLTAADVWTYSTRTLTTTIPTAAQNAAAVRSELATELARIDVATSTRLATAGYTAPPTAASIRSEIDANSTKLDVAVGTRLASASYVAPANADVAAIKAKTDNLPANTEAELSSIKKNTDLIPGAL
jgi:hypothetical protein